MKKKLFTAILAVSMLGISQVYAEDLPVQENLNFEQQTSTESQEQDILNSEKQTSTEVQEQDILNSDEQTSTEVEEQKANYYLKAQTTAARPDQSIYAHPGNVAKIEGVGEGNEIVIRYAGSQILKIPVSSPLYQVTNAYYDKICFKDGLWGIEREIGKVVFDGSEDWTLEENYRYQNTKSTLFTISSLETVSIKEGLSTHFQVSGGLEKSTNTAEGISLTPEKWYFRVSNVRNIKSVEVWKEYLNAQFQADTPVTLYYILPEATFTPFEDELQEELSNLDVSEIRYTEGVQPAIVSLPEDTSSYYPFLTTDLWQGKEEFKKFAQSFTDIKIYNAAPEDKFFIESIEVIPEGECIIRLAQQIQKENEEATSKLVSEARFSFLDMNFLLEKPSEVAFIPINDSSISATANINFSNFKIPKESMAGFTYLDSGIHENCISKKELVLPDKIPVVEESEFRIYYNNLAFNGNIEKLDSVITDPSTEALTSTDKYLSIIPEEESNSWTQKFTLNAGASEKAQQTNYETTIIPVPKDAGKQTTKTVMFLGDSLIAQDYYTQAVVDLFEKDEMDVKLIGTKGLKTSPHEGRGGWSSYDYCTAELRFGESNPFLNHGKFDFSYYMKNNNYSEVDIVILNLGINDLNQIGHNSHEEILSNFNKILESIQKFNPDCKVVFAMPTLPFAKDATITAKNSRLGFMKSLKTEFENREEEGIFLLPLYANIDPFTDYKFEQPLPNGALDVTDTSHPAVSGYQRLGETSFNMIKYISMLEEGNN